MIRYLLIVLLLAMRAYADVPFNLSWDGPTKRLNGDPVQATDYVIYACDGVISKPALSSEVTCSGNNLQTYATTEESYSGVYTTTETSGYIFFRVLARDESGTESLLSNLAYKRFRTVNATFPPSNLQPDNNCSIIVNQVCQ